MRLGSQVAAELGATWILLLCLWLGVFARNGCHNPAGAVNPLLYGQHVFGLPWNSHDAFFCTLL